MIECDYETVNSSSDDDSFSWKYFLRQLMVCSVTWVSYFLSGVAFGAPTVFIPQIKKENQNAINDSMQSWLASIFGFAALPWVIILTATAAYMGRKYPYAFSCIATLVASGVFYYSNTIVEIIVAEFLFCVAGAANMTLGPIILGEYTSPKYRGIFITFKSASFCWGMWISNAIGTFSHWKNIPLVIFILSIYPTIVIFFWPESPYFLASKSKFEECAKSHRWLKGYKSEKELTQLLSAHNFLTEEKGFFEVVMSKRFYKAFLLCVCLVASYTFCGKQTCAMYSIDIIKQMTSNETTAYTGMLILDGVTVFSMYVGTMLSKILERRVLFISCLSIGIVSLFILSAHVYLVQLSVLQENSYITLVLLSIYSIGVGSGPILLSTSLFCEIMPLQYKSFAVCAVCLIDKTMLGIILKFTPILIKTFGLHVAFFTFGLSSTICITLIYLYMPETKDKTLLEISDEIQGKTKIHIITNKERVHLAE